MMVLFGSCKKDDDTNSGAVELLSFGPAGVKHGEEVIILGHNLDKVTAIDFVGASVGQGDFKEQTPERIVLSVPQAAERGRIVLKTPGGDITSKGLIDFDVPVKVTSVTAAARPGDQISIKGEYVNWISAVEFAGDTIVKDFVSRSMTELIVKVPLSAKTGKLILSTGGTEPVSFETEAALTLAVPTVGAIAPNPAEKGKQLIITGDNLDLVKEVLFKGTGPVGSFVSKSKDRIVVSIPDTASKGKVTVVSYSGIKVESPVALLFVGDLPDLAPLGYALFADKLENGAQNWGWSADVVFDNTERVRDGDAAIQVKYQGSWGALKFANFSVSTTGYSELTFSIYGGEGSDGKVIKVIPSGGPAYDVTVEAGKWVEYRIPKANVGMAASMTDLTFQDTGWSGTVYIDHVGLR